MISLERSSTLVCPSTRWLDDAHALTMWIADFPMNLLCERRSVLPSIATTCPLVTSLTALTPIHETFLELRRVQSREDSAEGLMRWDAVGQLE